MMFLFAETTRSQAGTPNPNCVDLGINVGKDVHVLLLPRI